jgi:hypothetical protein
MSILPLKAAKYFSHNPIPYATACFHSYSLPKDYFFVKNRIAGQKK